MAHISSYMKLTTIHVHTYTNFFQLRMPFMHCISQTLLVHGSPVSQLPELFSQRFCFRGRDWIHEPALPRCYHLNNPALLKVVQHLLGYVRKLTARLSHVLVQRGKLRWISLRSDHQFTGNGCELKFSMRKQSNPKCGTFSRTNDWVSSTYQRYFKWILKLS
jgi:hypothetical protein